MNASAYYNELNETDATPAAELVLDAVAVDVTEVTGKIPAVKFELYRAEGLIEECGPAAPVTTWTEADNILRQWARTAPKPGNGYDKCDFTITFADGDTYEGRYDLKAHDQNFPELLGRHVRNFLTFYAGTRRPEWMTPEQYQKVLEGTNPAEVETPTTSEPVERITDTTRIAQLTREALKREFPSCKFSVTSKYFSGGSEMSVSLISAPFEVLGEGSKWERGYAQLNYYTLRESFEKHSGSQIMNGEWTEIPEGYALCNGAYITRLGWDLLQRAVEISQKYNWDNSDIQTDYFDVNYYFDINVGKWNKPFTVK